ncbi:MAG: aminomethyl-transferring glycine dehydrogenase subunit GcvPA [Clostridiales bacterium]|nr:aminomethyl-transferring glycine dehydrogenase subunit GcvPA [Clostridiales bacterium]
MFRYIPNGDDDRKAMLESMGINDIEELFIDIPEELKFKGELNLDLAKSEQEVMKYMSDMANKNQDLSQLTSFLGAGVYDHFVPSVIKHLASRSEFYTAYTPYQPEISQGTLQVIFEYQSMICELTGLDVSNASLYDGPTAAAEAFLLAATQTKRNKILVGNAISPEIKKVIETYMKFRDIEIVYLAEKNGLVDMTDLESKLDKEVAGVFVQNPNFYGLIEEVEKMTEMAHANKALSIAYVDPISLAVLKNPGEMGVDIAIGDGQSLGNGTNFGGPYLGFMASNNKLVRKLPGRIIGQTEDVDGKRAWALTLATREQHIRRYKATSNICSNQGLNALMAAVYMSTMGKVGLREAALQSVQKAHYAYNQIIGTGKFKPAFDAPFFKEFVVVGEKSAEVVNEALLKANILGGYDLSKEFGLDNGIMFAVTEKRTKEEIDTLVSKLEVL